MPKLKYDRDNYYKKVEEDLLPLILITQRLEDLISDYALAKTEDCWDEDFNQVVRAFFFEKDNKQYIVSLTPDGLIRMPHTKYPSELSVQIHNAIAVIYACGWITPKEES